MVEVPMFFILSTYDTVRGAITSNSPPVRERELSRGSEARQFSRK